MMLSELTTADLHYPQRPCSGTSKAGARAVLLPWLNSTASGIRHHNSDAILCKNGYKQNRPGNILEIGWPGRFLINPTGQGRRGTSSHSI